MTESEVWRLERVEHTLASVFVVTDSSEVLVAIWFGDDPTQLVEWARRRHGTLRTTAGTATQASQQLTEYFLGERETFDLKLRLFGTDFQRRAWTALQAIPYGETRTYGEQAVVLGQPAAVRAVGRANGSNPVPIVVPCHRVIGKNGSLTGFGGGIAIKQRLLAHEAAQRSLFSTPDPHRRS